MSCPSWQWHRTGSRWSPVRTLPVVPLWCDLRIFPNSRGNKAAANLRPSRPRLRLVSGCHESGHRWTLRSPRSSGLSRAQASEARRKGPGPIRAAAGLVQPGAAALVAPPRRGAAGPGPSDRCLRNLNANLDYQALSALLAQMDKTRLQHPIRSPSPPGLSLLSAQFGSSCQCHHGGFESA